MFANLDVSDAEDEIVQKAVSDMKFSAIRQGTQVINEPGSHQIFLITRPSGSVMHLQDSHTLNLDHAPMDETWIPVPSMT